MGDDCVKVIARTKIRIRVCISVKVWYNVEIRYKIRVRMPVEDSSGTLCGLLSLVEVEWPGTVCLLSGGLH